MAFSVGVGSAGSSSFVGSLSTFGGEGELGASFFSSSIGGDLSLSFAAGTGAGAGAGAGGVAGISLTCTNAKAEATA